MAENPPANDPTMQWKAYLLLSAEAELSWP